MSDGIALLEKLLELGLRILDALDAARAADFRRRAAADGAGLLLGQLNPGGDTGAAALAQSPEAGVQGDAGAVDEQR